MTKNRIIMEFPPAQPFSYHVGEGVLDSLGDALREGAPTSTRALVISDSNVAPLYGARVREQLGRAGIRVDEICIPAGETSKSLAVAGEIWQAMAQLGVDRQTLVVAVGGGVVSDLAGFVAATYLRGIPWAVVPTSLLAMVDAAIGGKTAIDLEQGKNLVGAFYQPVCICADTACLATLPERERRSGFGEVAKTALLDAGNLFFTLDAATSHERCDAAFLGDIVTSCALVKASVVADDPYEQYGLRECLNLGHTYGHALELLGGFGVLSHGECVAEGIRFAAFASQHILDVDADFIAAQGLLLDKLELPEKRMRFALDDTMRALRADKKRRHGVNRLVMVRDLGQWVVEELADDEIARLLDAWFKRKDAHVD